MLESTVILEITFFFFVNIFQYYFCHNKMLLQSLTIHRVCEFVGNTGIFNEPLWEQFNFVRVEILCQHTATC